LAARFFHKTLKSLEHPNSYPKKHYFPSILSQEEVARLIDSALGPYIAFC
jgi:hypothetical protein